MSLFSRKNRVNSQVPAMVIHAQKESNKLKGTWNKKVPVGETVLIDIGSKWTKLIQFWFWKECMVHTAIDGQGYLIEY